MRAFRPLVLALAVTIAGCAFAGRGGSPDPEQRLQAGLAALAEQDMVRAQEHLEWVYRNHPSEPVGMHALLAMTAAELDPRNPTRSLWEGADLAAQLLHSPDAPAWTRPLGHTLYLVALELGANEERMAQAQAALDAALPTFPGTSLPTQLKTVQAERDQLQGTVDSLQQQVTSARKELEEKKAELERIRKTIKG
jgi:hypothetical protein